MKLTLRTAAIAACAFAGAAMISETADARARVYIRTGYAASANYYTATGLPWYAVRAYYFNGPWSGVNAMPYSHTGWAAYAAANGIACVPGTAVKGGDGIMYNCQ